jgi:hypothetical protein
MRFVKLIVGSIFAALALVAGLVVTAVVAAGGLLVYLWLRLTGKTSAIKFQSNIRVNTVPPRAPNRMNAHDAIDVETTEVVETKRLS